MTFDFKRIVFTTLNFTPCFVSTNIIKLFFVFSLKMRVTFIQLKKMKKIQKTYIFPRVYYFIFLFVHLSNKGSFEISFFSAEYNHNLLYQIFMSLQFIKNYYLPESFCLSLQTLKNYLILRNKKMLKFFVSNFPFYR